MVLGFHIGTDNDGKGNTPFRRPGRRRAQLREHDVRRPVRRDEAGDRRRARPAPELKVLISEGAPWVPFIGDRMNEGYRQHHMFVRPVLSALPKEILYRQVYTSFQHDETAGRAVGDGLPERCGAATTRTSRARSGTPRRRCTSSTGSPNVSHRIRIGALKELFPHVGDPPQD